MKKFFVVCSEDGLYCVLNCVFLEFEYQYLLFVKNYVKYLYIFV